MSPAAWYCGFAQAFRSIQSMIPSPDDLSDEIPIVKSLSNRFAFFSKYKFPIGSPVSTDIKHFFADFKERRCPRGAQRLIMAVIYKAQAAALLQEFPRNSPDRARLIAVSAPFSVHG